MEPWREGGKEGESESEGRRDGGGGCAVANLSWEVVGSQGPGRIEPDALAYDDAVRGREAA